MRECKQIIIVEDDVDLCENLVEYFGLENFSVTGVNCVFDFFKATSITDFQVAIVDIGLPDKSGFEVVEHLRKHTDVGIIILTASSTMKDKLYGYEVGADYYFVKPMDSRELKAAINNLINRTLNITSGIAADKDTWRIDCLNYLFYPPLAKAIKLTPKEITFLKIFVEKKGSPVSREEILNSLDYLDSGSYGSRALDVMVGRLRKKIRSATTKESPIKTVHATGYSFATEINFI